MKPDDHKCAYLVAKGFSQVEGVDFDNIFSPVVRFETVRLMLALAALENWHIESLDIHSTYLYGKLIKENYMKQPKGLRVPGQEHKVLHLLHALCSLKQAGLTWWETLNESMKELVTILFLGSALFLISSFCATSPFPGSLCYAYHHYLLILGPLTFTVCTL